MRLEKRVMPLHQRLDATAREFQVSGNLVSLGSYVNGLQTPHLAERAVIAAKQMRYFRLFIQRAGVV